MSAFKGTPGPWSYSHWRETDDEDQLMACGWDITAQGSLLPLCAQTGDMDEAEANARLIAAAPELLEALEGLLSVYAKPDQALCCDGRLCGCMGASVYQQAEHFARAALAKATQA